MFAERMLKLSIALDQKEDALEYLRISTELAQENVESEKIKAVASHELQTTLRARDASLNEMKVEAENARLQLSASRSQFALAALSALALSLIALLSYRSFRSQKRLTVEKETFLGEIHHRTKNNFQVLSSILNLDIRRSLTSEDGEGRRLDAVNRLQTMALVHDHVYGLESSKGTKVDLVEFIDDLLALLDTSLGQEGVDMTWSVEGDEMDVTRLTPFGLLLCELVTNSYKHAFPDREGSISVEVLHQCDALSMTLRDNGQGFDLQAAKAKRGSIGMSLIFELAEQIGGDLTVRSTDEGTVWVLK